MSMEKGSLLITHIKGLVQAGENLSTPVKGAEMKALPVLQDAWLLLKDGLVSAYGSMSAHDTTLRGLEGIRQLDATGRYVFPSFCDAHTHIVYAGSREQEFIDKIRGMSYEEIAARGGGILNSARRLTDTSDEKLFEQAWERVMEVIRMGTGALEIKSGYGLNLKDELRMLRIIRKIAERSPIPVVPTFLGAHALPAEFRDNMSGYVDLVIREMIPAVAAEKLAVFIDVFCDRGFFSTQDTARILEAGVKAGLRPRIHANELDYSGGVQVGVAHGALSVDHLECCGDEEIECLLHSDTMPVLLPGTAFFLGINNPPARKMIDAGLPVALASDYNPGSCPSGNMKLVLSMACTRLKMLPEEAINATTLNAAYAMGLEHSAGSVSIGKLANVFITKKIPSLAFYPYAFGSELIETVIVNGKEI